MKKSEILFLYETSYNIPNGDPFTGEQRYDEETKKILVSDVRIKRFIRTYLEDIEGEHIYVSENTGAGKTDSKGVLTWIAQNWNTNQETNIAEIMKELIDVSIIRKTKCYRFIKRNVLKRKTKRLRYRCPPEPYSNSVRTDFFSYSNAIILESQQINTSI